MSNRHAFQRKERSGKDAGQKKKNDFPGFGYSDSKEYREAASGNHCGRRQGGFLAHRGGNRSLSFGGEYGDCTGRFICYGEKAMRHLQEISRVIFLDIPYEEMLKRIGDPVKRGVAIPEGFTLQDLYEERTALYRKYAEYTLEENGLSSGACVQKIMQYLDSVQ